VRSRPPLAPFRARVCVSIGIAALAFALAGCADTVQDRPVAHDALEGLIAAPFPVFWLGGSFHGLGITETSHDPSGALSLQYGDCRQGGQGTCVAPVRVVTSPDNSFVPGAPAGRHVVTIRGVPASLGSAGRSIVMPTGGVIVAIYALDAKLAAAAAGTAVPINEAGAPGAPLPAPLPDTGFARAPLPGQLPQPLAPPSSRAPVAPQLSCASQRKCGPRRR
jgi:hypothetical protein